MIERTCRTLPSTNTTTNCSTSQCIIELSVYISNAEKGPHKSQVAVGPSQREVDVLVFTCFWFFILLQKGGWQGGTTVKYRAKQHRSTVCSSEYSQYCWVALIMLQGGVITGLWRDCMMQLGQI